MPALQSLACLHTILAAEVQSSRLEQQQSVLLTAHVLLETLIEQVDATVREPLEGATWTCVALTDGPSLRTGRTW